jgi:hypothetical protein
MAEFTNPIKGTPKAAWGIALVAGGGVAFYVWWKKKHPTTVPAASGAAYGYASGYGYGGGYGYGVSPIYGYGQGGFPFMGGGGYGAPGGYGYQSQFPTPTTNAQWFQEAISWLSQGGTSATTAEAALGKYLAGAAVTSQQALIVQEAEGALGPPPVSGPNGYPPNIHTSGSGGGGNAQNPVTGLHVSQPGTTGVDIAWTASSGATSYKVTSSAGTVQNTGPTSARIRSINPPGHTGTANVSVLAEPAAANARAATITVKTR